MSKLKHVYEGVCVMKPDGVMGCAILWKKDSVTKISDVESGCFVGDDGVLDN